MKPHGFALFELLITLAAMAVLLAIALPSFNHFIRDARLRSVTQELHFALVLARQAAITRAAPVFVSAHGPSWNTGWTVFVDVDGDGGRNAGDEILKEYPPLPAGIRITSNFGTYARYLPNGRSAFTSGAFMAGTWLICPIDGGAGRALVMSRGGRVRTAERTCP